MIGWDFHSWFGGQPFLTWWSVDLDLWSTVSIPMTDVINVVTGMMQDGYWWSYSGNNTWVSRNGDKAHCSGHDGMTDIGGVSYPYYYFGDLFPGGHRVTRYIRFNHPTGHNSAAGVGIDSETFACLGILGDGKLRVHTGILQGAGLLEMPTIGALPDAKITVKKNNRTVATGTTNGAGRWETTLESGSYSVKAFYPALNPVTADPVTIRAGWTKDVYFNFAPCLNDDAQCLMDLSSTVGDGSPGEVLIEGASLLNGICNAGLRFTNGDYVHGAATLILSIPNAVPYVEYIPTMVNCGSALTNGEEGGIIARSRTTLDYWVTNPLRHFFGEFEDPMATVLLARPTYAAAKAVDDRPVSCGPNMAASLHLYDQLRRHTGLEEGSPVWNIPKTAHFNLNGKLAWAGQNGLITPMSVEIHGTDYDTLMLGIGFSYPDGRSRRVFFSKVPVTPDTRATIEVPPDGQLTALEIDPDGDGVTTLMVYPDSVETPPLVPKNVVVEPDNLGVRLSWDESPDDDLSHYTIYRCTHDQFEPRPERAIGTAPAGQTFFCDLWFRLYADQYYYCVTATDSDGTESGFWRWVSFDRFALEPPTPLPTGPTTVTLDQNYPNPFNVSTVISFDLAHEASTRVEVYSVLGRRIKTIRLGRLPAGHHYTDWDGTDDSGDEVSSGVYFYRVSAGSAVQTKKMLLVK